MKGKPKTFYMGILFSKYTPAVEGQLLRDCLLMMEIARNRYNELVICCADDGPERMLSALGLHLSPHTDLPKDWIVYRTEEEWPREPEGTRSLIQRNLYQKKKDGNMLVLDDRHNNGYYLPPQGRLSPDTISLLRPAPNGEFVSRAVQ
jgi:hypothetical protein